MSEELNKESVEMLDEYDFSRGVVGKYTKQYAEGTNIVLLDPDVAKVFPDSEAVNQALRANMCPNWLLDSSDRSQPNNGMHPTANSAALIENLRVITSRRGG